MRYVVLLTISLSIVGCIQPREFKHNPGATTADLPLDADPEQRTGDTEDIGPIPTDVIEIALDIPPDQPDTGNLEDLLEIIDVIEPPDVIEATEFIEYDIVDAHETVDTVKIDVEPDVCEPDCQDKQCGPDGCGGDCGECEQPQDTCLKTTCNEETGQCEEGSVPDEDDKPCDDTNPCTDPDKCVGGECTGPWLELGDLVFSDCLCQGDEDCEAIGPAFPCVGVLFCNLELIPHTCDLDFGQALVCNDDNPCTDDSCEPETGCINAPNNSNSCLDLDLCNGDEYCQEAVCLPGVNLDCDDYNPCTDDSCDALQGCQFENNADNVCPDDDLCNGDEYCLDGICHPDEPLMCNDDNLCTDDSCSSETGCIFENNSLPCDDDLECTVEDHCDGGACLSGGQMDCDDGEPCTNDSCEEGNGCVNSSSTGAECDDGDFCTINDLCLAGLCMGAANDECDSADFDHDGLPGTQDACPTAFDRFNLDQDGNGQFDACEVLVGDFEYSTALVLTVDGAPSVARRTNEPVEVPLRNGIVDSSVVGLWRFDSTNVDSSFASHPAELDFAADFADAQSESFDQSLVVNGLGALAAVEYGDWMHTPDSFSIMAWTNVEAVNGKRMIVGRYQKTPLQDGVFALRVANSKYSVDLWDKGGMQHSLSTVSNAQSLAWQHVAAVYDGEHLDLYVDGVLDARSEVGSLEFKESTVGLGIGNTADGGLNEPFQGRIDDVVWFSRALTADEVETYVRSGHPYGSHLAPGAQADYDDIRITEFGDTGGTFRKRTRVIGPRPHSDSECPTAYAETPVAEIPGIADRDDLCGVVANWKLDGDAIDSVAGYNGTIGDAEPVPGRFGRPASALQFGQDRHVSIAHDGDFNFQTLTLEAWVRPAAEDLASGIHIIASNAQGCGWALSIGDGSFELRMHGNSSGFGMASSPVPVGAEGRWFHIAGTFGSSEARLFVDGLEVDNVTFSGGVDYSGPYSVCNYPLFLGESGEFQNPSGKNNFHGEIDEVLLHSVVKSSDYIFHRTRPGVPKVRFLARTTIHEAPEDGYPFVDYELLWGNAGAPLDTPFVAGPNEQECHGLLNQCLGYAGWWRLNEGRGLTAIDWSTGKANGVCSPGIQWAAGTEGMAFSGDGDARYVYIADRSGFYVDEGTWEAIFSPGKDWEGPQDESQFLFSKLKPGQLGDYALSVNHPSSKLRFAIEPPGAVEVYSVLSDTDIWQAEVTHHAAARVGTDGTKLFVDYVEQQDAAAHTEGMYGQGAAIVLGGFLDYQEYFDGLLDGFRFMNRALEPDEMLHYPLAAWEWEVNPDLVPDGDGDGVPYDGDLSGIAGDQPCIGGQVTYCDDNAPDLDNPDQADGDWDGVGDVVDNCPNDYNPDQADGDENGIGVVCDPTEIDWDHDGLMPGEDDCPYAWDPDNLDYDADGHPDACEPLETLLNMTFSRALDLHVDGAAAPERRTHQPVDIPLQNGIADSYVLGHWRLDGDGADETGAHPGEVVNALAAEGAFGDDGGALDLSPEGAKVVVPDDGTLSALPAFTVMTWFRPAPNHGKWEILVGKGDTDDGHSYYLVLGGLGGQLYTLRGMVYADTFFADLKAKSTVSSGEWHHGALTWDGGLVNLYLDGTLVVSQEWDGEMDDTTDYPLVIGGHYSGAPFTGDMDDVLLLSRAMSPTEITGYVHSSAPYGTSLVPGAQADFDDVRISEMGDNGIETVKRSRIVGLRPHSNTPCPYEDLQAATALADREDLCGVAAYWPLDGTGEDLSGNGHDAISYDPPPVRGRFGDEAGATAFQGEVFYLDYSVPEPIVWQATGLTVEAWVRVPPGAHADYGTILAMVENSDWGEFFSFNIAPSGTLMFGWDSGAPPYQLASSYTPLDDNQWHHVAAVMLDKTVTLYLDGRPDGSMSSAAWKDELHTGPAGALRTGWAKSQLPHWLHGEIDDLLIHSVAKSPGYLFSRANPGLPSLRFLANTAMSAMNGLFPARDYQLRWGDQTAQAALPFVGDGDGEADEGDCYGLVNKCMGYVGWWLFDEGRSDTRISDESCNRNDGEYKGAGTKYWIATSNGLGKYFDGAASLVHIPFAPSMNVEHFTMESHARVDLIAGDHTIIARDSADQFSSWRMAAKGSIGLYVTHKTSDGETAALVNPGAGWPAEEWFHLVGTYDGTTLASWVNGLKTTTAAPGPPVTGGAELYFGANMGGGEIAENFFNGVLDFVRIMNRALVPDEFIHSPPFTITPGEIQ
jgi:hypothetical protein